MSDAARLKAATEAEGSTRLLRRTGLTLPRLAMSASDGTLAGAAKRAQQWTEWGGRTDPGSYLADMARTLEYKRLINIQNWLTFTSPQTAYAWREKERLQAIQMNYALWGGYTTPDQYLGYLQRQRTDLAASMRCCWSAPRLPGEHQRGPGVRERADGHACDGGHAGRGPGPGRHQPVSVCPGQPAGYGDHPAGGDDAALSASWPRTRRC